MKSTNIEQKENIMWKSKTGIILNGICLKKEYDKKGHLTIIVKSRTGVTMTIDADQILWEGNN